jgi:hypothetical protein
MPETSSTESVPKHRPEGESETDSENELATSPESASATTADVSAAKSPETSAATTRLSRWSRWIAVAALVLAVIAAAGAGAAWYRLTQNSSPKYSAEETASAKKNLCAAYAVVQRAVVVNNHLAPPNPNDPTGKLAVEANARLALVGGGGYLRDRVTSEPAASADLTKTLTATANDIEQLGMNYTAGASGESQDALKKDLDSKIGKLKELCA